MTKYIFNDVLWLFWYARTPVAQYRSWLQNRCLTQWVYSKLYIVLLSITKFTSHSKQWLHFIQKTSKERVARSPQKIQHKIDCKRTQNGTKTRNPPYSKLNNLLMGFIIFSNKDTDPIPSCHVHQSQHYNIQLNSLYLSSATPV